MKELVQKIKDTFRQFTASKTRVAIAFAVVAALVGAILLLPPPRTAELGAGAPTVQQTVTLDAGTTAVVDGGEDASVVIDLPAPEANTATDAAEQH